MERELEIRYRTGILQRHGTEHFLHRSFHKCFSSRKTKHLNLNCCERAAEICAQPCEDQLCKLKTRLRIVSYISTPQVLLDVVFVVGLGESTVLLYHVQLPIQGPVLFFLPLILLLYLSPVHLDLLQWLENAYDLKQASRII